MNISESIRRVSNNRFTCVWVMAGALLACFILTSGCARALLMTNTPSKVKLRMVSADADKYTITVAEKIVYTFPTDGRITVDIPQLPSGDATYILGIKVASKSSYDVPAICLKNNGKIVKHLSLNDLAKLRVDGQGYHVLKAE